jgi:hypothetical protein
VSPFLNIKRWSQWVLVCLFGLGLVLPLIGSFYRWHTQSLIDENRPPAAFPEWRDDPHIWEEYREQWETFFDDHFGFRNWLIAAELKLKHVCFPS